MAAWPAVALVGSYELLMMVIRSSQRHRAARPVARAFRIRFRKKRPRYSPTSWRRIVFLQSARSVLSSTSASLGRSGCGTTWPQGLQGGLRMPLREQLAGRVVKLSAEA